MKLKKIASLALAGIMAVSMLAGCGEAASSEPTTPPETTVTAGIADPMNKARNNYVKNNVEIVYKESDSLTGQLQTAVEAVYKKSGDIETAAGNNSYAGAANANKANDVIKELKKVIPGTFVTNDKMPVNAEGTNKLIKVYTVGGNYGASDAGNLVGNSLNNVVTKDNMSLTGNNLKATYSADVAAVKVTSRDDANVSAWVVAVVYTQSIAKTN